MTRRVASTIQRRRLDGCRRAPVPEQRELAERLGQLVAQPGRAGVAVGALAPVGVVDRPGGDDRVDVHAHRVPPADVGDLGVRVGPAQRVPDLLAGDEAVGLPPEHDLAEVAEEPAVADGAVLGRQPPGEEGRLHRAGHRGQHGAEGGPAAPLGERPQPGHVLQRPRGQPHDVEEQHRQGRRARGGSGAVVGGGHGVSLSPRSSSWSRTHATSPAMRRDEVVVGAGSGGVGQHAPGVGLHLEVVGHGAVAADEGVERGPGVVPGGGERRFRVEVERHVEVHAPRHGRRRRRTGRRAGRSPARASGRSSRASSRAVRMPSAHLVQEAHLVELGQRARGWRGRPGRRRARPAETWALVTGSPAPPSRPRTACGSSKPTARWHRSRLTPIRSVSTPARRSTASALVSTTQPGSGSRPTRTVRPVRASMPSSASASRPRLPSAAVCCPSSQGVRHAKGRVETLPRAASSGSSRASTAAQSTV